MSYYQLNDIKRDRVPYSYSGLWIRPTWVSEIVNTPYLNLQKTAAFASISSVVVETQKHFSGAFRALNFIYEYPKNSLQWSIYTKEIFKVNNFFSDWRKKLVYGVVQHSLDSGFKIAMFHYVFGNTWSPYNFSDYNSIKYMIFCFSSAFLAGWTQYPLEIARRAYYADMSWDESLRKGYRSPLHALVKIPFVEGPTFLFRGGMLHWMGNTMGLGCLFWTYAWLKDKFFFTYKYCDLNYSFVKTVFLVLAFSTHIFGQPFFYMRHIMDTFPRERGGKVSFETTGEAYRYLKMNWMSNTGNITHGYWRWFREYGIVLFGTIWLADNIGFMDNFRVDANSYETTTSGFITD